MALGNPAENLEDVNPLDDPEKEDQQKNADSKDTEGLSTAEQKAIEKGHTTIDAVVTERNRLAQNADAELEAHIRPDQDGHQLVDLDEQFAQKNSLCYFRIDQQKYKIKGFLILVQGFLHKLSKES